MILCATHPSDILVLNILGLLSLPQRVSVPTDGHQDQFVHAWSLPKSHMQSFQCWQPESFPFGSRTIGCTRHWCLWGLHASPKLSNNYSCSHSPSWRWNTVLTGSHWSVGGSDSLMERFTSSLLGQLGPLSTTSWSVPRCQLLIWQSNIHATFPFILFEYLMRHLQSVPLIRSSFWPSLVPFFVLHCWVLWIFWVLCWVTLYIGIPLSSDKASIIWQIAWMNPSTISPVAWAL